MLPDRSNGVRALTKLVQVIFGLAVFWLLFVIIDCGFRPHYLRTNANYVVVVICLLCSMVAEAVRPAGVALTARKVSWVQAHFVTVQQVSFIMLLFLALILIAKESGISRAFLATYFFVLYGVLLATNRLLPAWFSSRLFNGSRAERVLAIRTTRTSQSIEDWLALQLHLGLDVVKTVMWTRGADTEEMLKVLTSEADELGIQHLLLLDLPEDREWLGDVVRFVNRRGIRLLIINNLHEQIGHSLAMFSCDGLQLITLRSEPLESPFNRMVKRVCDIAVSLPIVLFILPILMALVKAVQWRQAPGQLFYRQKRSGMNNEHFLIFKFRTMYARRCDETQQATNNDDRIFPMGRWIRRLSLDEMPQFINVLQGSMSVVGPRPHMVEHNAEFSRILDSYNARTFIKPGITGLAQVRGLRGEVAVKADIEKRLKSDMYYLENWTLGLDFLIVLRTIVCLIAPPRSAV